MTFFLFNIPYVISIERYSKKFSVSGWNMNKLLNLPLRKPSRTQLYWLNSGFYGKKYLKLTGIWYLGQSAHGVCSVAQTALPVIGERVMSAYLQ